MVSFGFQRCLGLAMENELSELSCIQIQAFLHCVMLLNAL